MAAKKTRSASPTKVHTPRGPRRKRSKLTSQQQSLVARYEPLARKISRSKRRLWPEFFSEIESAAHLALVEAAEAFRPELRVNFATFARFRITGAMHDVTRTFRERRWLKKLPNERRSFHFVPGFEEACSLMLTSPDPDVGTESDAVEQVAHWLSFLPPRHALVCRELYLKHRTQTEVAAQVGLAKSRICAIHAEALQLLRELSAVQAAALDQGLDVARN